MIVEAFPMQVPVYIQDSFDNIWIGTWGGGINFISRKPPLFTTLSYSPIPNNENSLNNKVASSLCTDRQGRIWIGTDGGGINVFEGDKRIAIYKKETETSLPISY